MIIRPERRVDYSKVMPKEDVVEEPRPQTLLEKLTENFYEGVIGQDRSEDLK